MPPLPPSRVQGLHRAAPSACGPHTASHQGKRASTSVSPSGTLGSDLALHRDPVSAAPEPTGGRTRLSGGGQEPHCRSSGHRVSPNSNPLPWAVLAMEVRAVYGWREQAGHRGPCSAVSLAHSLQAPQLPNGGQQSPQLLGVRHDCRGGKSTSAEAALEVVSVPAENRHPGGLWTGRHG